MGDANEPPVRDIREAMHPEDGRRVAVRIGRRSHPRAVGAGRLPCGCDPTIEACDDCGHLTMDQAREDLTPEDAAAFTRQQERLDAFDRGAPDPHPPGSSSGFRFSADGGGLHQPSREALACDLLQRALPWIAVGVTDAEALAAADVAPELAATVGLRAEIVAFLAGKAPPEREPWLDVNPDGTFR